MAKIGLGTGFSISEQRAYGTKPSGISPFLTETRRFPEFGQDLFSARISFLAKLRYKSEIQCDCNQKLFFAFELHGDHKVMNGVVFIEECPDIYCRMQIGCTYRITYAILKSSSSIAEIKHSDIYFDTNTFIEEIRDISLHIDRISNNPKYGLLQVKDILSLSHGSRLDFIGQVIWESWRKCCYQLRVGCPCAR